ncbi:hypothetical protein RDI58_027070 [Solanum bulbocastanum]|uniref:Uncharacterized protein n=1 Tax=Solanum bulbocastanum TaxID=147425 RepID=A0AAN8SVC3_SOLBU
MAKISHLHITPYVSPEPSSSSEAPTEAEEEERDNQEDIDASNSNDTIVQFVQEREFDQVFQHQLIEVIRNMWAIPGSRTIFESGILSKSSGIGWRRLKKARKESRRVVKDKEEIEQQRDTLSSGALVSGPSATTASEALARDSS